jgi:hypothetical protein
VSQFATEPNFAVAMGRNTNEPGSAIDPAVWPWFIGFEHSLSVPRLAEIGMWINANVPGGCRLQQPKWYYFTSEEDALLAYLMFK